MARVLEAKNLSAGYERGRDILRGLTFTVDDGNVLVVVGPNGSGKTTLLRTILGLLPVGAGTLRLFGKDGPLKGRDTERLISYIPQRLELDRTFPLSVREFLRLSAKGADRGQYVGMLELGGLLDRAMGELSGGQTQRVLLCYAIARRPRLLIMDEPTSWVDARGADCILCVMEEFRKQGIAMLVVTHDFEALEGVATHVLGIGADHWFFSDTDKPETSGRIKSLAGADHHGRCGGKSCGCP